MNDWKFSIATGVRYKDAVYFYDYLSTKLYKMDLNDRMISIYGIFEDAASIETALYGNSCIYNNKAWFIPNQATNIALVDVEKQNNIRYFPLKFNIFNEEAYNKTHQRFKQIIKEKNNKIFLIPTCMDTVIEINLETEEFVYHYDIINPQEEIMGYGAVVDNCLWIFPIIGNKGKKLNILSNDIEEFDWNIGNGEYECTIAKGKNIFFSPGSTTSVMELDTETFNMNTYAIPAEYDGGGSTSMARIMDNILWIARDCSNNGVLFF